jgi:hypothetical protein
MDIKAVQAEAANKATAWLTSNLPVADAAPPAEQAPPADAAPAAVTPPAGETPPAAVVPAKPGLADAIRQNREQRQTQQTASLEVGKYKAELEAARKEIESLKTVGSANDPFEFLKHRKLSKEQQALWGQAFLYDLKPEVAPQEFRLELYKAEQARQKEQERLEKERLEQEQAQQMQREHLDRYANEVFSHIQSSSGSYPESEMWFTEDGPDGQPQVNHRVYAQSLLATADNLARRAQAQGQQADLSPANIARALEAEVSKRMARRDAKRGSKPAGETKQVPPAAPAQSGAQATGTTTSAEGLRSGAPLPKDMSDEARRARAIAVLAGTK